MNQKEDTGAHKAIRESAAAAADEATYLPCGVCVLTKAAAADDDDEVPRARELDARTNAAAAVAGAAAVEELDNEAVGALAEAKRRSAASAWGELRTSCDADDLRACLE